MIARRLLAAALLPAVLAGCSGGEEPRGTVNVPMYDNFFAREVTRVPAGATVRFPNEGRTPHNAVAVDGTWRTPGRVGADEAAAMTPFTTTVNGERISVIAATSVIDSNLISNWTATEHHPGVASTGVAARS